MQVVQCAEERVFAWGIEARRGIVADSQGADAGEPLALLASNMSEAFMTLDGDTAQDLIEYVFDAAQKCLESIKGVKVVKETIATVASLPNYLFMRKLARFYEGVIKEIPLEKRASFIEEYRYTLEKYFQATIEIIAKCEESDTPLFSSLFSGLVYGYINRAQYRKLLLMAFATAVSDLRCLLATEFDEAFTLDTPELQGFASVGWFQLAGQTWANLAGDGCGTQYRLGIAAEWFLDLKKKGS